MSASDDAKLAERFQECCDHFRSELYRLANVAGKDVLDIYRLWLEYASSDQSALLSEFEQWYAKDLQPASNDADLRHHDCREAGQDSWWEYDAQGIELDRVCNLCREVKLAKYRPCILEGYTQADVDEPIEEEL